MSFAPPRRHARAHSRDSRYERRLIRRHRSRRGACAASRRVEPTTQIVSSSAVDDRCASRTSIPRAVELRSTRGRSNLPVDRLDLCSGLFAWLCPFRGVPQGQGAADLGTSPLPSPGRWRRLRNVLERICRQPPRIQRPYGAAIRRGWSQTDGALDPLPPRARRISSGSAVFQSDPR